MRFLLAFLFCVLLAGNVFARPNCPDGTCFRNRQAPRTERYDPDTAPQFDLPGSEPEAPTPPAPQPPLDIVPVPEEGGSNLLTIIGIVSGLAGAVTAFLATREEDDEEKEEIQPNTPAVPQT